MRQLFAENWLSLLVLGALGLAFTVLRTSPSNLASLDELKSLIGAGRPVLIKVYTNT
ncbi:MAG: hypothetical protein J7M15_06850 [Anaerolineae bacterium]|nr:hypothetical protein [Anaerolineae bacterium]